MPYFYGKPTLRQRIQTWFWNLLGLDEVFQQFEVEFVDLYREVDDRSEQHWAVRDIEDELDRLSDTLYELADDVADLLLKDMGFDTFGYGAYGFDGYNPADDPEYTTPEPALKLPDPAFAEAVGLAAEPVLPSALASDPQWADEDDCI